MSFTDFLENELLDHVFGSGNRNYAAAANQFVALSTTIPTDAGGNFTEPAVGAYARVSRADTNWTVAAAGALDNNADIVFPTATANWGTIVYAGIFDLITAGNLLMIGDIIPDQAVNSGNDSQFDLGAFDVTLD